MLLANSKNDLLLLMPFFLHSIWLMLTSLHILALSISTYLNWNNYIELTTTRKVISLTQFILTRIVIPYIDTLFRKFFFLKIGWKKHQNIPIQILSFINNYVIIIFYFKSQLWVDISYLFLSWRPNPQITRKIILIWSNVLLTFKDFIANYANDFKELRFEHVRSIE